MTVPGPGRDDRPIVWRLWWRFVYTPFCRLLYLLPISEWRAESISMRVDVWAMDHVGRIRFHR